MPRAVLGAYNGRKSHAKQHAHLRRFNHAICFLFFVAVICLFLLEGLRVYTGMSIPAVSNLGYCNSTLKIIILLCFVLSSECNNTLHKKKQSRSPFFVCLACFVLFLLRCWGYIFFVPRVHPNRNTTKPMPWWTWSSSTKPCTTWQGSAGSCRCAHFDVLSVDGYWTAAQRFVWWPQRDTLINTGG